MPQKKSKDEKVNLNEKIRDLGFALIVWGVIHLIFSNFLDGTWGIVLIIVGIISLFYRSKMMVLVFGILLIIIGILNISSLTNSQENSSLLWVFFGIAQIYWGIIEIKSYRKLKENPKYVIEKKKNFVWYGLRIGFWAMIIVWLGYVLFVPLGSNSELYWSSFIIIASLLFVVSAIFTFVLSIVHLNTYKNKVFAIICLVFSSFLVLLMFGGFISVLIEDSGKNYEPIQITDDNNELIKSYECNLPNKVIGLKCCIPDPDIAVMCQNEGKIFSEKFNYAMDNSIYTEGNKVINNEVGISFIEPPNYIKVGEYPSGGFNILYSYFGYDTDNEGYIDWDTEISITIIQIPKSLIEDDYWGEFSNEELAEMEKSFLKGTKNAYSVIGYNPDTDTNRIIKTDKGYTALVVESKGIINEEDQTYDRYLKQVLILNNGLILTYGSPQEWSSYVEEFDQLLNSITIIN